MCGKERTDEIDYNPLQLIAPSQLEGDVIGWYSGEDGEICGPDMLKMFKRANGL